jgi:hypothetical protein
VRRTATSTHTGTTEWGRARLLGILVTATAVAVALVAGGVYVVGRALATGDADPAGPSPTSAPGVSARAITAQGAERRDQIAAAPMLQVPAQAAFPAEPADQAGPSIEIPAGAGIPGPGLVMTGFPHTPEGAIGQLAQIDLAVLQAMSLPTAVEVYNTWALPGGVGADHWWITASVRAFLANTQMGQVKDPGASVTVDPAAALVKGTDGPDWTTVCVLLKVTATYRQQSQVAFSHCERMQWVGGRWMLAPGPPPAPAPATWPGTALAIAAGWRTWTTTDHPRSEPDR